MATGAGLVTPEGLESPERRRSMVDNQDPRAVRTREKLIGAFHEAIRDADPRTMSVSALTRAAGVNRTSFYGHFSSPEDLAIHAISELFDVVGNADVVMRAEHRVTGCRRAGRHCGRSSTSSRNAVPPTCGCSAPVRPRS